MDRQSKREPSNEERYLVSVGLPIVAKVRIRDRLPVLPVEVAGGVLEKNMVATDSHGRNNQIGAKGGATDEQGILWS